MCYKSYTESKKVELTKKTNMYNKFNKKFDIESGYYKQENLDNSQMCKIKYVVIFVTICFLIFASSLLLINNKNNNKKTYEYEKQFIKEITEKNISLKNIKNIKFYIDRNNKNAMLIELKH